MQGWSNQALEGLFYETIRIVNEKFEEPMPATKRQKHQRRRLTKTKLRDIIGKADGAKEGATKNEARLIYTLAGKEKSSSVLSNHTILQPHPHIVCSYSNPRQSSLIGCERPVSPTACGADGRNFGPELMFAHFFPTLNTKYEGKTFGITKVCPPGTNIEKFQKDSGTKKNFWHSLEENIRADNGTIEAFFWFQGESDEFVAIMTEEEYLERLIALIGDVRQEIFKAHRARWGEAGSPTARFDTKEDIPVVLCELGPWIGNSSSSKRDPPGKIIRAQRKYANEM